MDTWTFWIEDCDASSMYDNHTQSLTAVGSARGVTIAEAYHNACHNPDALFPIPKEFQYDPCDLTAIAASSARTFTPPNAIHPLIAKLRESFANNELGERDGTVEKINTLLNSYQLLIEDD